MIPVTSLSRLTVITATSSSEQKKPISPNSTALKSLARSGKVDHALRLIESQPSDLRYDAETYSLLLHACISKKSLSFGRRLQNHLRNSGENLISDPKIRSKLITLFSVCGRLDEARSVFRDNGLTHNESDWVAMAIGYSKNGSSDRALALYSEMLSRSVQPGKFSFSTALKAAAELRDLRLGRAVHAQTLKREEALDQVASNALLGLYLRCGSSGDAQKLFNEMPQRNVVSWNSLISDSVARDLIFEAFEAFRKMQREGTRFSWVTLTTVLSACARSTALTIGKEIHAQMVKSDERPDLLSINSLLDMYAKCGEINYCQRVFDAMRYKDSISWNTMINGYCVNGLMEEAAELFDSMVNPDGVTFIALLSGFSHAGLTEKGKTLFDKMRSIHGVKPAIEHYACLVDILGRAGQLKEALRVIETMPMKPGSSVWGSLLNSSRLHGDVTLGELAASQLFELEPRNPGNYVMLSNIYADKGLWEGVKKVRETMERNGIKKSPGCSWIQVRNGMHTFVAGGSFEFRNSPEFEEVSKKLRRGLDKEGYRPDTSVVLHDVGEETKESWVCGHSERIATVFALVNAPKGVPIRVTKNLRVCNDCHSWMKHVSKVVQRAIIVRDTNRFHHFRGGRCSCKDYW